MSPFQNIFLESFLFSLQTFSVHYSQEFVKRVILDVSKNYCSQNFSSPSHRSCESWGVMKKSRFATTFKHTIVPFCQRFKSFPKPHYPLNQVPSALPTFKIYFNNQMTEEQIYFLSSSTTWYSVSLFANSKTNGETKILHLVPLAVNSMCKTSVFSRTFIWSST